VAECEEQRTQLQNRKRALEKLSKDPKFVGWAKAQAAAIAEGYASLERKVDEMMKDDNLKVEYGKPD
jgi:hypothetical protein